MKIGLVGIARNEAYVVSEWIAYHLALGFDAVTVYDNRSTDDTAAKVTAAAREVDARLKSWFSQGSGWQNSAYDDAATSLGDEFEWLAFLDLDEFLDCGSYRGVHEMVGAIGHEAAIGLNWAMFGSNGHDRRPRGLMTAAYTRRAGLHFAANQHIKSLIRTESYIRVINPHIFEVMGSYTNAVGGALAWLSDGTAEIADGDGAPKVNHFFVKSREEWAAKALRGYRNTMQRTDADFLHCDRNDVEDLSSMIVGTRALNQYAFLRAEMLSREPRRSWLTTIGLRRGGLQPLTTRG